MEFTHAQTLVLTAATAVLIGLPATTGLSAQTTADDHAPIGVMGDHLHSRGEIMLSYRFMRMEMDGNRIGTESVSAETVLDDFMVTPTEMPMGMHMFGLMWAPSDRVTLMGMTNWTTSEMDHLTRMGGEFTTESSGIGDTRLTALVGLTDVGNVGIHVNAGVSLPTGSIDETDVTPASAPDETRLPYPMQIGSGTFDLLPGITVFGTGESGSWGLQAGGVLRTGENDRGYTLGDQAFGTGWLAYRLSDAFSASVRVQARHTGNIEGSDPALNPMMIPTARTDLRGGTRVDVPLGFNWYFTGDFLHDHRLAIELSLPVYQDLDGPQLETDWILTLGWQKAFQLYGDHGH